MPRMVILNPHRALQSGLAFALRTTPAKSSMYISRDLSILKSQTAVEAAEDVLGLHNSLHWHHDHGWNLVVPAQSLRPRVKTAQRKEVHGDDQGLVLPPRIAPTQARSAG